MEGASASLAAPHGIQSDFNRCRHAPRPHTLAIPASRDSTPLDGSRETRSRGFWVPAGTTTVLLIRFLSPGFGVLKILMVKDVIFRLKWKDLMTWAEVEVSYGLGRFGPSLKFGILRFQHHTSRRVLCSSRVVGVRVRDKKRIYETQKPETSAQRENHHRFLEIPCSLTADAPARQAQLKPHFPKNWEKLGDNN